MPPIDGASFEDCYRRVFPLVLAKCRRMLRGHSDANDVTQEVFVRLWRHRELVRDEHALTAWLYQTSTRLVIDRARQRTLSRESLLHLEAMASDASEELAESRLASRRQLSLIAQLPARELEAMILNRFDRLTHIEIAEVMDISERTVRRLLNRFDERVSAMKESSG
jgi:RNA polymerase sigma-70 factor (ECF subfamily)